MLLVWTIALAIVLVVWSLLHLCLQQQQRQRQHTRTVVVNTGSAAATTHGNDSDDGGGDTGGTSVLHLHTVHCPSFTDASLVEVLGTCPDSERQRVRSLLVVIPGNPGVVDVYDEFLCAVQDKWNIASSGGNSGRESSCGAAAAAAVVCIGYAGHTFHRSHPLETRHRRYTLQQQIEHIRDTIAYLLSEQYTGVERLFLAGHSVGSYVITQLLRREEEEVHSRYHHHHHHHHHHHLYHQKLSGVFLLFPTVHRIAQSPNGQRNAALVRHERTLMALVHLADVAMLRSETVKRWVVRLLSWLSGDVRRNLHNEVIGHRLQRFMSTGLVANVVHMARHEFAEITEMSNVEAVLRENLHRLYMYFSTTDQWTPMHFVDEIRTRVFRDDQQCMADRRMVVDPESAHAFVIHRRDIRTVSKWIVDKIVNDCSSSSGSHSGTVGSEFPSS